MERTWNPRQVLDVYPGDPTHFHCSGTTLKGVRCKNSLFFEKELLREAAAILDTLPHPQAFIYNTPQLLTNLRRLAFCTLCPRWHQGNNTKAGSQIETVSRQWLTIILRLAAQGPQPRSGSHRSTRSRSSQASTLPSMSEALSTSATISARPSRRRYPVDGPYPSPPPSGSTTPTTSHASSSDDSTLNNSYRGSNGVPSTDYSSVLGSSSRRSTSSRIDGPHAPPVQVNFNTTFNIATVRQRRVAALGIASPSGSSSHRSTSSRICGPHAPPVQINFNTTFNIQAVRQRRVAALDISSSDSTPPSTPSPPQSPPHRTSISSTRSVLDVVPQAETETTRAQRAERFNHTARTSNRSSSRASEDFRRSFAPEPSVISNLPAPLAVIRETFPSPDRNPSRRPHPSPISASAGRAGEGPSGRNGINTPISTDPSTPVTSRGDEQSFEATLDAFLNSPSSPSSDTPSSSRTSTPTRTESAIWPTVEVPSASAMSPVPGNVRRRRLSNTNCYICYEAIEHYEDTTWCRRSCGQNVHLECFETWRDHMEGTRPPRAVTCAFCRAPWSA